MIFFSKKWWLLNLPDSATKQDDISSLRHCFLSQFGGISTGLVLIDPSSGHCSLRYSEGVNMRGTEGGTPGGQNIEKVIF